MITFESQGIDMPHIDTRRITTWINNVATAHDKVAGNINYVFVNDETILKVNREFLQHDYYTDIITFDYSRRKLIQGDIYISVDTVRTNALKFGYTYPEELLRVIIHGVLHLCGINDKGPGEREIMEQNENQALQMLNNL